MTYADERVMHTQLGVMLSPGLATGFPDLVPKLARIYTDKVAKLPWVPKTWLESVLALQAKYPGDLVRPTPGRDAKGERGEMAPMWADTPVKLDAWHKLYSDINAAIQAYAKEFADDGAAQLNALYADAAFWSAAVDLATTVRDLPGKVVQTVAGGAGDVFAAFLPDALKGYARIIFWSLVVIVVGGLVLWYRNKAGAIVKGFKGAK